MSETRIETVLDAPAKIRIVAAALEVAAAQYRRDARTQTSADNPRLGAAFELQAEQAEELRDAFERVLGI